MFSEFRAFSPEFCRIQNQFWVAEPQPVFALARYDAAAIAFRRVAREILAGLPGRSLERLWLGVMYSPPSLHFGAAVFALRYAPSEDWCQRLESNQ